MRASVSGATINGVLSARDTVMAETPANLATSLSVVSPVPRRDARGAGLMRLDGLGTVTDVTANVPTFTYHAAIIRDDDVDSLPGRERYSFFLQRRFYHG